MSRLINRLLQSVDWMLLVPILLLSVMSVFTVSSATSSELGLAEVAKTQMMYLGLGLIIALVVSRLSVLTYYRSSVVFYILTLLTLVAVLIMGAKIAGARRWLIMGPLRFQPSEVVKIALILYMARMLQFVQPFEQVGLRKLLWPLLSIAIPTLLVLVEPDFGTSMIIFSIGISMVLFCRVHKKLILSAIMVCVLAAPLTYFFVLKDYQRQRVVSFLDPAQDPRGAGYNAIQSMIAIGSGRFWGKGYGKGTQSRLDFIPEQHTDFIFSAYSEEWGFMGVIFLLLMYLLVLMRLNTLASQGPSTFATLFCLGYAMALTIQIVMNIGMVSGLLPVVGMALPFLSYGGSSIVANFFALGICMGIKRQQIMFQTEI